MKNVSQVSLGELLKLERRPVKVVADSQYAEIGMYCFGRGIFHKTPRSGLEVGNKDLFLVREGDFIFQITFAWEGAVGLATASEDSMYCSTRFPTFRVDENRCFPPYLVHYFKTHEGREQLVKISPGSAGRNRVLSLKRISEVSVPLPPLSEQKRITAKLEELSAKIEEARGLRQQAVEEADALWHAALKSILNKGMTDGWALRQISEVAETNPSKQSISTSPNDMQVSFVSMSAVDDITGTIKRAEIRHLSDVKKGYTYFAERDVIFAKITPCMQNGKSAIAKGLKNGIGFGSTEFHVMRPKSGLLLSEWLYAIVRHKDFKDDAAAHFKGTAGQQRVPQSFLAQKTIPVPPLPDQRRIVAYLDGLQTKVDALKRLQTETAAELNAMLPSALDRAFKGELV